MTDKQKLLDAICDIDKKMSGTPCSLILWAGTDNGKRYVDFKMVSGHIVYNEPKDGEDIADDICENLTEAILELAKQLQK